MRRHPDITAREDTASHKIAFGDPDSNGDLLIGDGPAKVDLPVAF
jgi:hypothetical protein